MLRQFVVLENVGHLLSADQRDLMDFIMKVRLGPDLVVIDPTFCSAGVREARVPHALGHRARQECRVAGLVLLLSTSELFHMFLSFGPCRCNASGSSSMPDGPTSGSLGAAPTCWGPRQ